MTLRKPEKPIQKPLPKPAAKPPMPARPVVKRAPKPVKPAKKLTLPLAKQRPLATLKARKAVRPGQTAPTASSKKPSHPQDITPSTKVMPSPTARPVITPSGPLISDNTLTTKAGATPTAPMIHKRTMLTQPPSGVATAEEVQSIGLETPFRKSKEESKDKKDISKSEVGASDIQAAAMKVSGRPAKPLTVKPLAAGPTIAELLKAKQQADEVTAEAEDDKAVEDIKAVKTAPIAVAPLKPTPKSEVPKITKPAVVTKVEAAEKPEKLPKPPEPAAAKPDDESESVAGERVIAPPSAQSKPQPTADVAPETTSETPEVARPVADLDGDGLGQKLDAADAPAETPPPKAELYGGKPVIIVHEPHPARDFFVGLLVFIVGLAVILVGVNFLLDANMIQTGYKIPHTNLLEP